MIPELVSLEGEIDTLQQVMEPEDYNYLMGTSSITKNDVRYYKTKYPEYMGFVASIISALAAVGAGVARGIKGKRLRRKARMVQGARAKILQRHAEIREHNKRVFQAMRIQQSNLKVQNLKKQKQKQLASVLIPVVGITALAFLLL